MRGGYGYGERMIRDRFRWIYNEFEVRGKGERLDLKMDLRLVWELTSM